MKKIFFLLFLQFNTVFSKSIYLPQKNQLTYTVIVEAAAKLLEFDIIRETLNYNEKQIVSLVEKKSQNPEGISFGLMGAVENIAQDFDEVSQIFLNLQQRTLNLNDAEKFEIMKSIKGLISLLDNPYILHSILPLPQHIEHGYLDALNHEQVLLFIKAIQSIAFKKYIECSCEKNVYTLSNEGKFFYDVIKQTLINMFHSSIEQAISYESNIQNSRSDSKKIIIDPQDAILNAIFKDSYEDLMYAVSQGGKVQTQYGFLGGKQFINFAIELAKPNAVKALLDSGAPIQSYEYSLKIGDLRTALILLKKNAAGIPAHCHEDPYLRAITEVIQKAHIDLESSLELIQELINLGTKLGREYHGSMLVTAIRYSKHNHYSGKKKFVPVEILNMFYKNGSNLNQIDYNGSTPLFAAIQVRNIEAIKFLLEHGADINQSIQTFSNNPRNPNKITTNVLSYTIDQYNMGSDKILKEIIDILQDHIAKCLPS